MTQNTPLNASEIERWQDQKDMTVAQRVTELMRRRLLRRTHFQQEYLALSDLESIESRAADAIRGMRRAHEFDYVIPNHDGEDSDHWRIADAPIGDAGVATQALAAALEGPHPSASGAMEAGVRPGRIDRPRQIVLRDRRRCTKMAATSVSCTAPG